MAPCQMYRHTDILPSEGTVVHIEYCRQGRGVA